VPCFFSSSDVDEASTNPAARGRGRIWVKGAPSLWNNTIVLVSFRIEIRSCDRRKYSKRSGSITASNYRGPPDYRVAGMGGKLIHYCFVLMEDMVWWGYCLVVLKVVAEDICDR
jgi:hypothetical protein